jgi:hypothetical protein
MEMTRGTWQQVGVTRGKQIDGGLVDARWLPEVVRKIASGNIYPSLGFGATNNYRKFATSYNPPKKKSADIPAIGERWHIVRRKPERGPRYKVVEHDVDYGKTWIHRRLATPEGQPGRMTLYHTMEQGGHDAFMEQVTSEVQVIKKGIIVWEKIRTNNHWLDALVYAATAARMLGVKVTETEAPSPSQANQSGSTRANAANTPTIRSRYLSTRSPRSLDARNVERFKPSALHTTAINRFSIASVASVRPDIKKQANWFDTIISV